MWTRKPVMTYDFELYGCVHECNPNQILYRLKKVILSWVYTDDEYFY